MSNKSVGRGIWGVDRYVCKSHSRDAIIDASQASNEMDRINSTGNWPRARVASSSSSQSSLLPYTLPPNKTLTGAVGLQCAVKCRRLLQLRLDAAAVKPQATEGVNDVHRAFSGHVFGEAAFCV